MTGQTAEGATQRSAPIVTLFEMYGSGATTVGPRIAEALGVPWVSQVFSSEQIETAEAARVQEPDDSLLARVFRRLGATPQMQDDRGGQALFTASDRELVEENTRTVLESTRNGGVILGRNATIILADQPRAIHVLLTGAVEDRIARAASEAGIDRTKAARRQASEDVVRREMSERLYAWNPQDPSRYDLVVNTSRIDLSTVVELVVAASRAGH